MSVQFVATIAGVNGPIAENEQEAVVRLTEYMESSIGKRHFHDANPDKSEQQYQEILFQLYDRDCDREDGDVESRKDHEAIIIGELVKPSDGMIYNPQSE